MSADTLGRLTADLLAMRMNSSDPSIRMPEEQARRMADALLAYDRLARNVTSVSWEGCGRIVLHYRLGWQGRTREKFTFVYHQGEPA